MPSRGVDNSETLDYHIISRSVLTAHLTDSKGARHHVVRADVKREGASCLHQTGLSGCATEI